LSFARFIFSVSLACPLMLHAAEATIELNNGDLLTAELIEQTDNHVTLNHPALGEITIDKTNVRLVTLSAAESAEQTETTAEAEVITVNTEDNGLLGTGLLTGWERRIDLGIAGSGGKSSSHQVNVGFTADFDSEYTRISSRTAYFRNKSEGELSDHSFYSAINRDWLRPSTPWFHFAGGRYDLDEFKDWNYRVNANAGVGYEFANTDSWLLLGRTGLGFSQTFGGEREEFIPEGLLGVETKWRMNNYQKIKFANTLYPSLKDTSEFRNLTSFDWILDLNSFVGVALKVGLLNEYDSATEEGISKNDFKYTVSLAWTL
jgi:putative salt-induced outer membrane protein YdiY